MSTSKQSYPIIHLNDDAVLFPNILNHVTIHRGKSLQALMYYVKEGREQVLFVPQLDHRDPWSLNPIGVIGDVIAMKREEDSASLVVAGRYRVRLTDIFENEANILCAHVRKARENHKLEQDAFILRESIMGILQAFAAEVETDQQERENYLEDFKNIKDLNTLLNLIMFKTKFQQQHKLEFLNENSLQKRLYMLAHFFEYEVLKNDTVRQIRERAQQQMSRNHQEYVLNEQLKAIQKELGEINPEMDEYSAIQERIESSAMPEQARKKAETELKRLKMMPSHSSEASVSRVYLEWLCDYPWQKSTPLKLDLSEAEALLDEDHYGLEEIKNRIMEHLALLQRNPDGKAPILCFVGPPGVGKTSLGQSIARSMGRAFERIALGGLHDEAEIRGHRRTYIGSQPGKIIQRLCKLNCNNPLILLDEIDKIGHDYRGDPADALLEVLDPAQNHRFSDHYLETEVDLSKVMFIATANTMNIPPALRDRMEIIQLPGYTQREKEEIGKRFLLPRQRDNHVLSEQDWQLDEDVLPRVIADYTREAGMRQLERELNKLARKVVRELAQGKKKVRVSAKDLSAYLGVPKYQRYEEDLADKQGVVTGLAWTSVGGELLYIEALQLQGKGKLSYTGQLGSVMQESVQIAYSVVKKYLQNQEHQLDWDSIDLHLHLPEGAVPKDGPSAGIALASVILSALCAYKIRGDVAMTGEISLQGRVLAIGGLKEKLMAAVRGGIRTVLIPRDNEKDLQDVPDEVKNALEIVLVRHVDEVFMRVFRQETPKKARRETASKSSKAKNK